MTSLKSDDRAPDASTMLFTILVVFFCVILVISNIASTKMTAFLGLTLDAGTILFPFSYIFGDIFAEIYGWRTSKKIILLGCAVIMLNALILMVVQYLPAASFWEFQSSYEAILGLIPRITLGSILGYLAGSFANTWSLLWIREITRGRWLPVRTIGSTLIGQTADTVVFCIVAFVGTMGQIDLITLAVSNIVFKVGVEIACTPITVRVIRKIRSMVA